MKRLSITILFAFFVLALLGQNRAIDTLWNALKIEKTAKGRIDLLCKLSYALQDSKPDSALLLAQQAYFIARDHNLTTREAAAFAQMAAAYKSLGNFSKSLEYYIAQLKIEEPIDSAADLTVLYLAIASLYDNSKDWDNALFYAKKADSIIIKKKLAIYAPYSLLNIGDIYEKKNMLDSAIIYTSKCLDISVSSGNTIVVGTALNNLGNIYSKSGNYAEAIKNYKRGIPQQLSSSNYSTYTESCLGIARVFEQTGLTDSAIFYGRTSFTIAVSNQFTVKALDASIFLTNIYKVHKNTDSAFAFQEIMIALKDSIESRQKIKELQNISTAEQLRQAELEQLKEEQIQDRKEKLQLLFIGIMIPLFFLLSIVISQRKVHKKLIEFTGIVSVLLFFEYITLLLHPFIAEKSNHSPIVEIIIFVAIAAIITPAHHRIQHWLLNKLSEYNYLKHHKHDTEQNEAQKNITEETQ